MVDHEPVIRPGQCFIDRTTMGRVRLSSSPVAPSSPELWSSIQLFQTPLRLLTPTNSLFFSSFRAHRSESPHSDYIHTSHSSFLGVIGRLFPFVLFPYL